MRPLLLWQIDNTKLKGGESLVAVGYPVSFIFGDGPTVSEGTLTNTGDTETMLRRDGFYDICAYDKWK